MSFQPEKMTGPLPSYQKKACVEYQTVMNTNQHLQSTLKEVQNELYSLTKPIRVTDDDYSTIIGNLGKLFGKINNFAPHCKSSLLKKAADIGYLFSERDQLQLRPLTVDYPLLAILVEKYIIETLMTDVFKKAVHLNDTVNDAYTLLSQLFSAAGHEEWAKDLRLKSARSTWELIHADPSAIDVEKQRIVEKLTKGLSSLYPEDVAQPRLKMIVDMATDLCLPIHGQENPIEIYHLSPSDRIIQNQVKRVYHPLDKDRVYLSVSPVFLAKSTLEVDDDVLDTYLNGYTLIYPGKAIW